MIELQIKKEYLITLTKAENDISKITKDLCVYSEKNVWIRHLCISLGYLRDSINSLNKEIEHGNRTRI